MSVYTSACGATTDGTLYTPHADFFKIHITVRALILGWFFERNSKSFCHKNVLGVVIYDFSKMV